MASMTDLTPTRKIPALAKWAMQLQVFLLRRKWVGALGDEIMVITTTGRKSGQKFSTPIGYLWDGPNVIALTQGAGSNWYKNVLSNSEVLLEIKGQPFPAQGIPVNAEAERQNILRLYQRDRAKNFQRLFRVPADAPEADLQHALANVKFVRFQPSN